MAISKYQAFETITINRSQIKNAEYNPRIMGKKEKERLRKAIRENGLVSALTWNKRTGNLVGGHQRLEQLDAIERSNDYELTVCVIDVYERNEVKINVQLNNPSMQGTWDLDKLANITMDFDLSLNDMGFSKYDAEFLFDGDERFTNLYDTPEAEYEKEKISEIKKVRSESMQKLKEKNNVNFYAVVVFANEQERSEFFKKIHVPATEDYITVEQVERLMGK